MNNKIENEKEILDSLVNGDESAFQLLYEFHFKTIYVFVLGYVKSPNLAEDICQEIFMKIWYKREQLAHVKVFQSYLYIVAKHHTLNQLRAINRSQVALQELLKNYPSQEDTTNLSVESKEYDQFIQEAFQKLSPISQQVFSMCRDESLSYDEVAKEMGFSRNAVKKHMVKAMKAFRVVITSSLDIHFQVLYCIGIELFLKK